MYVIFILKTQKEVQMCPKMEYYTIMLNSKDKKELRLKMVLHVKQYRNIALAAKEFRTKRKTVYKWIKRL